MDFRIVCLVKAKQFDTKKVKNHIKIVPCNFKKGRKIHILFMIYRKKRKTFIFFFRVEHSS